MESQEDIYLLATHGLIQGETIVFEGPEITFGRTSQNDVVLAEHAVSRQHAKIFLESGHLCITDLGSKNGTMVNKKQIQANQKVQINPDDTIQLGSTILKVVASEKTVQEVSVDDFPQTDKHDETFLSAAPPKKEKKKISFQMPKLNRRVLLYGGMVFFLLIIFISSNAKRAKQQNRQVETAKKSTTIEIPEQFETDSSTPQKIPTQAEIEVLLSQAESAIRFEDYHKAIRIYERVLKVRPEDEKVMAYFDIAKQNLYRKIQINRDIAIIEVEKLNFEKAQQHWKRIAELTQGLDTERYQEAQDQIKSLQNLINDTQ